jgi:hypothetical protein
MPNTHNFVFFSFSLRGGTRRALIIHKNYLSISFCSLGMAEPAQTSGLRGALFTTSASHGTKLTPTRHSLQRRSFPHLLIVLR